MNHCRIAPLHDRASTLVRSSSASLVRVLCLPALAIAASSVPARADIRAHFGGDLNPATTPRYSGSSAPAWIARGPGTSVSFGADAIAWRIDDTSTAAGSARYYEAPLTAADITASQPNGWTLRCVLEPLSTHDATDASVTVSFADGIVTWTLLFGTSVSGEPIVQLVTGSSGAPCPSYTGPTVSVPGAGQVHQFELVRAAASSVARLRIDGVEIVTDYSGHSAPVGHTGASVLFGSVSDCTSGGARFASVDWAYHHALPAAPGFDVTTYAIVEEPTHLVFAPNGDLYTGRDSFQSSIRPFRFRSGVTLVEELGSARQYDPDGIALDVSGALSGTAGSLVCSNGYASGQGELIAISPSGAVTSLTGGATSALRNPNSLEVDIGGQILVTDDSSSSASMQLDRSNLGPPPLTLTTVFSLSTQAANVAVDALGRIYTADRGSSGTIRIHDASGVLVNGGFATNLGPFVPLALGPGGVFGTDVYTIRASDGSLLRILPSGSVIVIGSGFALGTNYHLEFGLDGALYLSRWEEDRILRIAPASPLVTAICAGDGSLIACPCGNESTPGSGVGCLNSLGTGGRLAASGLASVSSDTLVLAGSNMPNSSVLYFQGTSVIAATFGDGLRCAAGTVIRLGTTTNVLGASTYPNAVTPTSVSVRGMVLPGDQRAYQAWYRNPAAFCTIATFNLTNGLLVAWSY